MNTMLLFDMDENFSNSPEPAKKKRRGPSKQTVEQRGKASTVAESAIQEVYDYWCHVMRPNRKNPARLDAKGRTAVAAAIADYGIETCRRAIDGCAMSDFHMGRNKQNKRYDSLELIFRDHGKIEQFLGYISDDED